MKKTSVFLTILLVVSLIFAVSCPGEKPSAKITSPVGDDAKITAVIGEQDRTKEVVIELANDIFNEEAFNVIAGNETDLSSWFTSSDATKATVTAKIKSLEEAAATKADEAKKYVKATVVLSVHPLVATAENTPVKVAFKIPVVTGEAKKWTASGKELTAENAIEITVEEKKEPSLTLTSPTGTQLWRVYNQSGTRTYNLELTLANDKFDTQKVASTKDASGWFAMSSPTHTIKANFLEGTTDAIAKVAVTVTGRYSPESGITLSIKIPANEGWTTTNKELTASNDIKINIVTEKLEFVTMKQSFAFTVGSTDEKTVTYTVKNGKIKADYEFSDLDKLGVQRDSQYSGTNITVKSIVRKSETELDVTLKPTQAVTTADQPKDGIAYTFQIPEEAFTDVPDTAAIFGPVQGTIDITVSNNS